MAAISVWIKLYMSKDDQNPSVIYIKGTIDNVYELKKKIKEEKTNDLKDIDADRLEVYPQGTDTSNMEGIDTMDPGKEVPIGTTSTNPLIVLPNEQWLQRQEQLLMMTRLAALEPQPQQAIAEDVRELKKLIVEKIMNESKAVSYAEYYREKVTEGRIENWDPTPTQPFFDANKAELPKYLEQAHLHVGSEKDVVKPFWKGVLEKYKILPTLSNGFETAHLGTKTPDISFFREGIVKPADMDFVVVGDCKGSSWSGTSAAELGQIILYVHRMLDVQPMREIGYGFVTNNKIFVLVKGYRSSESPFLVRWCISGVLDFNRGMKLWLQLMQEDTGYVEPPIIRGFPVEFGQILRPGGTCRAFGAKYRGELVVAKLYSSSAAATDSAFRTARAADTALATRGNGRPLARLPSVLATEGRWSLVSPKGIAMTRERLTKVHIEKLVSALHVIHSAGIIHRDVRMSNIFYLNDNDVLLNDWGSSVLANERTMYAGSPMPHIHPGIVVSDFYQPSPKHDLYSLVSSVAQLLLPGVLIESRKQLYTAAFHAAETCDYEGVIGSLNKHMRR